MFTRKPRLQLEKFAITVQKDFYNTICHEPTLGKPIQSGAVVRMASLEATATETLLAIHLRPVELGSAPKAIKFFLHAPPDVPSA
jgi:hypothetical protein